MTITTSWLNANVKKERPKSVEKADRDGLSVRLSPKGKVTFTTRYLYYGEPKRVDIGSYPLMSLKEAREESQRLRKKLEEGHDPKIIRKVEKQSIKEAVTFEELYLLWNENAGTSRKNHAALKRSFEIHVFPKVQKLPTDTITLHHWLDLLEALAKDKPFIADRILMYAKIVLRWGIKRKLNVNNPLADIRGKEDLQINKRHGHRILSEDEIRLFFVAMDKVETLQRNVLILKLCLMYGCRKGELLLAEKTHFDFDSMVWTVPASIHKTGGQTEKPIVRPIIDEVVPLLETVISLSGDSIYMFPHGNDRGKPLNLSWGVDLPKKVIRWIKKNEDIDVPHWTVHDLRRTCRTNLSTICEPHVAEIMLGHTLPGVWKVYDHYDYLEEQAVAYRAWYDRLKTIECGGQISAKVTHLRQLA